MLDELSHSYVLYCQSHRFEESHLILCEYKEPDPELGSFQWCYREKGLDKSFLHEQKWTSTDHS